MWNWAPCAVQALPTSYLFYTWQSIYVKATLSVCPTLSFMRCVHKYSFNICISLPALPIGASVPFSFIFHEYALIGNIFSLSDLLHSVKQDLGSSTSLQLTTIARMLKQPRCPWIDEWIKKLWYAKQLSFNKVTQSRTRLKRLSSSSSSSSVELCLQVGTEWSLIQLLKNEGITDIQVTLGLCCQPGEGQGPPCPSPPVSWLLTRPGAW